MRSTAAPRSPSSSWIAAPAGPVVGRRAGAPARRSRSPSGPGETTISARNAINAIPSSASSVSSGTCSPRATAPGRVRASYPVGRSATEAHAASGACRHRVAADQRGPGTIGGARRHRGAGGHRSVARQGRTVSASPTGSSASSGAGTRTSRSRARPGSCAAARDRNWSSASLSSATASTRMS